MHAVFSVVSVHNEVEVLNLKRTMIFEVFIFVNKYNPSRHARAAGQAQR